MSEYGRMMMRAAVCNAPGSLDLEDVHVDAPAPGEVRVRVASVGLCHSDLHYVDGTHTTDLPEILGHEAAGVVEAVGIGVTSVQVGDHVVTSLTMFCGRCRSCVMGRMSLCSERARLRRRSRPAVINGADRPVGTMGGIGAFAEYVLVRETGVVRIPDDLAMDLASLFGCAILTGVGAVTRSARVEPGATVAVFGCGGIGLAAVQGARIAGAARIVAIDLAADKLDAALRFGATDVVDAAHEPVAQLRALVPEGIDYTFEAVGRRETVEAAFDALAPGGRCTVLGMVPDDKPIQVTGADLYFHEKVLTGAFIGSSRFTVDIPQLITMYQQGRLMLDELITHRFALEEINDGLAALSRGEALRAVVEVAPAAN